MALFPPLHPLTAHIFNGTPLPWFVARHAFIHTTYPIGYVKNLKFAPPQGQRHGR